MRLYLSFKINSTALKCTLLQGFHLVSNVALHNTCVHYFSCSATIFPMWQQHGKPSITKEVMCVFFKVTISLAEDNRPVICSRTDKIRDTKGREKVTGYGVAKNEFISQTCCWLLEGFFFFSSAVLKEEVCSVQ